MAKTNVGAAPNSASPSANASVGYVQGRVQKKIVVQPYTDPLPTSPSEDVIVIRVKP